jgi:hypothetical protein
MLYEYIQKWDSSLELSEKPSFNDLWILKNKSVRRVSDFPDYEALPNLEITYGCLLGPEPWEDVPFERTFWVLFFHICIWLILWGRCMLQQTLYDTCVAKFPFPLQVKEKRWHIHYLLSRQGIKKRSDSGNKRKRDTIIRLKEMSKITKKQQLRNDCTASQFFL